MRLVNDKNLLNIKLNNDEINILSSFNHFDKYNYLIEDADNLLIATDSNIYVRNDNNVDLMVKMIYEYNLSFNKVSNERLISALNELFKGLIITFNKSSYSIIKPQIKKALLAGGCFWCSANAYFNKKGIINIFSGYAGGTTFMPTYEEVKKGDTKHKESILIYYDEAKTSYKELLDIFFLTIDPFDGDGQFIDRGDNYKTAIFTDDEDEINIIDDKIKEIEELYQMPVKVVKDKDTIFYMAEEYHQNYAQKNPKEFEKELIESGRIKK